MTSEQDRYGEDLDPPIDDDPNARLLWPGDNGNMPFVARETCVVLMRRTHIWSGASKRSALLWQAALDHQDSINSWLNAVFLELHLDERNEIAYKLQADRGGGQSFPTLLYDTSYNRDEIDALLHLRREHIRAVNDGDESAYVDRVIMLDMLKMSRPNTVRDHKTADARAERAIERLTKDGFLVADSGDEDRLRISPFVETLLTVDRLPAFIDALHADDKSAGREGGGNDTG
jgi:hypothetical protein